MDNKDILIGAIEERLDQMEEKINDLSEDLSKTTFTSIINGMILEDLFFKMNGKKKDLDRYYEEAKGLLAQYYEEKVWDGTTPGEIDKLESMLTGYESELLQIQQKEQRYIQAVRKASEKLEELEQLRLEHNQLKNWTFGLINELKQDKGSEQLTKNYMEKHPTPTELLDIKK